MIAVLKQTFREMFVLEGAKGCQKYRPIVCDRIRWSNQLRRDTLYTDSEAGRNTLLLRRLPAEARRGSGPHYCRRHDQGEYCEHDDVRTSNGERLLRSVRF